ncbi:LysR family transcriptional regulator [Gryllotalpicola protaetiae]|uniref:LysR family transcriptional regulator n=1 Tax=Gryllotalpicola protaetiae TaxID=2419771 RepID=A0A387C0A1_9MICO|nr:LysR family transcriptional regulator [Gryllotalpicola protaetiae]AYG03981.1 LysR family transcriptional regulator [Gryllotalpicola protaetiae]
MTLSQLRTFALVARLGSLRAAAAALGISEPAVSSAVAALRAELRDPLFRRSSTGITLTPGGRALAERAGEMVGLAEATRRDVAHAGTSGSELRVLATAAFAEHAAGRVFDLFGKWMKSDSVDVIVEVADDIATLLRERAYDIALGARPALAASAGLEVVPFFKYQRVMVVSRRHPLAASRGPVPLARLLAVPWFAGPGSFEPSTEEGRWFGRLPALPEVVELTSETDALAAVAGGEGVMLALRHVAGRRVAEPPAGAGAAAGPDAGDADLVRLTVADTPIAGMWWATTLDGGRATAESRSLQRFVTTAAATTAIVSQTGSRGLSRRGNKFHVALWS